MEYPGCPAHVIVDDIKIPTKEEIIKLMQERDRFGVSEENRIEEACMEDIAEREWPN